MQRKVKQIKDLEIIEKELNSANAGVLAFLSGGENLNQLTKTYVYQDKNIYLFFSISEEIFSKLPFDSDVKFTTIRDCDPEKEKDSTPKYHFFKISVNGVLKKVDDSKVIKEVRKKYLEKYTNKTSSTGKDLPELENVVIIDTEEFQASEEKGG